MPHPEKHAIIIPTTTGLSPKSAFPFVSEKENERKAHGQHMNTILIDGLTVLEEGDTTSDAEYIKGVGAVDNLILKNVVAVRKNEKQCGKILVIDKEKGSAQNLLIDGVYCKGFESFAETNGKAVHTDIFNAVCDCEPIK